MQLLTWVFVVFGVLEVMNIAVLCSLVILTAAMLGSLVVADGIATLSDVTADPLPLVVVFAALAAAALGASWDLLRQLRR